MNSDRRRIVVDTSTLVGAVIKPSSIPARALDLIRLQGDIAVSHETLDELRAVLDRDYLDRYSNRDDRQSFLALYEQTAIFIEITEHANDCRDPKDNKFLSLALSANATLIISSDADLQVLHPYRGIAVLSPAQLIALAV